MTVSPIGNSIGLMCDITVYPHTHIHMHTQMWEVGRVVGFCQDLGWTQDLGILNQWHYHNDSLTHKHTYTHKRTAAPVELRKI